MHFKVVKSFVNESSSVKVSWGQGVEYVRKKNFKKNIFMLLLEKFLPMHWALLFFLSCWNVSKETIYFNLEVTCGFK